MDQVGVLGVPERERLVDLDQRRSRPGEVRDLGRQHLGVGMSERAPVPIPTLQDRSPREAVRPREHRLDRVRRRGRPGDLELAPEDRPAPRDRPGHDRLAEVEVRVEVPEEPVDRHVREVPGHVRDRVVPAHLPVRHELDTRGDLLTDRLARDLVLDALPLVVRDLPALVLRVRAPVPLCLRRVADARVRARACHDQSHHPSSGSRRAVSRAQAPARNVSSVAT